MKKEIKVSFVNFWPSFNIEESILYKILNNHFHVHLTNIEKAEYLFYSVYGDEHWFAPEKCIKIFYTGENRTPDFNACDYAIGFERLSFGDRYIRFPLFYTYKECSLMEKKHLFDRDSIKKKKTRFCSFTVSNPNSPQRIAMFEALNKYKQVNSGGRYLNNIGGPINDKFVFDSEHKFSIAFENFSYNGYCTEKIVQAFAAQTIPIYYGDPLVTEVFNKNSFINVLDYQSFEEVVLKIREIDNNPELYFSMLGTPALTSEKFNLKNTTKCLECFLLNIFRQPLSKAHRRTRFAYHMAKVQQNLLKNYYFTQMSIPRQIFHKLRSNLK